MSENALKQIINQAVIDPDFRNKLLSNPTSVIADFELTDEEKVLIQNLSPDNFDTLAGSLEERISRARGSLGLYRTAVCQAYTDAC